MGSLGKGRLQGARRAELLGRCPTHERLTESFDTKAAIRELGHYPMQEKLAYT
jgi:hypothetical protein